MWSHAGITVPEGTEKFLSQLSEGLGLRDITSALTVKSSVDISVLAVQRYPFDQTGFVYGSMHASSTIPLCLPSKESMLGFILW